MVLWSAAGFFIIPWFFDPSINPADKTPQDRIALLKKHVNNFIELWNPPEAGALQARNFAVMKRFIKIYINDFEGAKELREKLMQIKTSTEILALLK